MKIEDIINNINQNKVTLEDLKASQRLKGADKENFLQDLKEMVLR